MRAIEGCSVFQLRARWSPGQAALFGRFYIGGGDSSCEPCVTLVERCFWASVATTKWKVVSAGIPPATSRVVQVRMFGAGQLQCEVTH